MALPEDLRPNSQLEETKIPDCPVDTPDQEGESLLLDWGDSQFRITVAEWVDGTKSGKVEPVRKDLWKAQGLVASSGTWTIP
jgi:hypothetical protein